MDKVRELVETVILTGRVAGCDPLSLALISDPEHGKTSVVLQKECKGVMSLTDVTGRGIQQLCQMHPEITHFVLNDLMAISGKKPHVMQGAISMLSAMTEEGIRATAYPDGVQQYQHGKRGIIVCMTPIMAKDKRTWWNRTGFSSRLLPFCFSHSASLKIKINLAIQSGAMDGHWTRKNSEKFPTPAKPRKVKLPRPLDAKISALAAVRAAALGEEGYRRHHQYRGLARAHALLRGWGNHEVGKSDLEFVGWVDEFVSYHEAKTI